MMESVWPSSAFLGCLRATRQREDWVVLHSLGLARRANGPYGEIDFVVIIPSEGIVCLEVKGGRVSCEAGIWRTMDRYGRSTTLKRSPFIQAREGMFAVRNSMVGHFGEGASEFTVPNRMRSRIP